MHPWVRWTVLVGCVITVAIALGGAHAIWMLDRESITVDRFWFTNALGIGLAVALVAVATPRGPASRFVRLAVALPIAHAIVLVIAWRAWVHYTPQLPEVHDAAPFARALPIPLVVGALAASYLVIARVVGRRRRGEWIHALAILALVHLLLAGLWLPIAARIWWQEWMWTRAQLVLVDPPLLAFVLLPPLMLAIAFTVLVIQRPEVVRRAIPLLATLAIVLAIGSLFTRLGAPEGPALVYGNFTHVVLATGLVAALSVLALGVVIATRMRRARRALARSTTNRSGVILRDPDDETDAIACVVTHWLRGPRVLMRSFVVETTEGPLHVPSAELVLPVPCATTVLGAGEAVVVLRHGDRVTVGGFVEPPSGHPFRETATPLPGSDGLLVTTETLDRYGFANLAHAIWRPCIAYLIIVTAVALPALAGLMR
ncbi:MAG TPA: hypothetical protein VFQ53_15750 [Kofleriaceae bacterium]|nr:hypothetical protein [Kofleriaceae bacterium]